MKTRVEDFPSVSSIRFLARRRQAEARARDEKRKRSAAIRSRSITPGREQTIRIYWS